MIVYGNIEEGMKITVIGDGAWGTALALLLHDKKFDVYVWGAFPEYTKVLNETHINSKYLPNIRLPEDLKFTNDLSYALKNSKLIVMAVPSHVMREVARKIAEVMVEEIPVVSVAKGIEAQTMKRLSKVIMEEMNIKHVAVLSGPSHAEEVAIKKPTAVTSASKDEKLAKFVQEVFSNNFFRVYTNTDIVGVELCATLKNILAIAAGAVDGLKYGDNAKSALLTRGLVEMIRFGTAMGGNVESFFGLAGIGDLTTTCFSVHGRNRLFGERIAQGMSIETALKNSQGVVEGYRNAKTIYELATKLKIDMPITKGVYKALYENKDLHTLVEELMTRDKKSEQNSGRTISRILKLLWLKIKVALTIGI